MIERALIGIAVAALLGAGGRDAAAQDASRAAGTAAAPPAAEAQAESLPLAVRAGSPVGPAQFTVFCDVSDDACGRLVVVFAGLFDEFPDQVGLTFRHHAPQEAEPAHLAYRAVLAAARQARGWQMLGLVCANADRLDDAGLRSMAAQLGLDLARFGADAGSAEAHFAADQDSQEAATLKLDSAPAVFMNGSRLPGPYTLDSLASAIQKR
jgi:protein-disulfide isomerase